MFIPSNKKKKIGDWVITTKVHSALCGTFTKGSKVKITDIGPRGYEIEDEDGHCLCEIGWVI